MSRPETIVAPARYCGMRFEARTADVVLDVGANIGWYSVLCDRMAEPGVGIFAFEPDPENAALLRRNIERNHAARVQVITSAVSDSEREATLHRFGGGNRGQHTLLPLYSGDDIRVKTTTLDHFWSRAGLGTRRLRLLKIDIEGHEAAAMRSAAGLRPHVFVDSAVQAATLEELRRVSGQVNLLWMR